MKIEEMNMKDAENVCVKGNVSVNGRGNANGDQK